MIKTNTNLKAKWDTNDSKHWKSYDSIWTVSPKSKWTEAGKNCFYYQRVNTKQYTLILNISTKYTF